VGGYDWLGVWLEWGDDEYLRELGRRGMPVGLPVYKTE